MSEWVNSIPVFGTRSLHHLEKTTPSLWGHSPGDGFVFFPLFLKGLRPFHIFPKHLFAPSILPSFFCFFQHSVSSFLAKGPVSCLPPPSKR